uniref:Uncharacterized protein n=1 Tax=Rhabditophanes sp. KR3021 TaxID=114890 RepID=A0AC35U2K8_9BILA
MKAEYLKAYKDCEHARNELKKNEMYVKKMKEIITNENSMNQRDPRRGRDISNPRSRNRSNSTDRIRAISLGLSSDKLP